MGCAAKKKNDCDQDCHDHGHGCHQGCDNRCEHNSREKNRQGQTIVEVVSDLDADRGDDQVQALGEGVTITLPRDPTNGQTLSVVTTRFAAKVRRSCHDFCGTDAKSLDVAPCTEARFTFVDCEDEWVFTNATVPPT